jgi:hypothetical protein
MKKFILLIIVIVIFIIVWNRQRIYVHDPFASVTRDGVTEQGAQIFINYSNDVLIENDNAPMYVMLVQHGQHVGVPAALKCMHYIACMTNADVAMLVLAASGTVESMSGKEVVFRDATGRQSVVTLR